jgi:hypothetical protein
MGCWNETCGFTNLPITANLPCRMMFIKRIPRDQGRRSWDGSIFYSFDLYQPVSILAKGTYNDYGWMDFAEGEEERLFESSRALGLGIVKKEDDNPKFPAEVHQWMIREDTFQMLRNIPLDAWGDRPKSVGESMDRLATLITDHRDWLIKTSPDNRREDFMKDEEFQRAFGQGETAFWPLKHELLKTFDRYREVPPDVNAANGLVDLMQIFTSMNAVRKVLAPTTGCGSQDYNEGGYAVISSFMNDALAGWKAYLNEDGDWDYDPEAEKTTTE